jgi:anti-anti-sigma factor
MMHSALCQEKTVAVTQQSPTTVARRGLESQAERHREGNVVWLRGEHDLSTTAALSATIARAVARNDADVVLDLSAVEFMGAATVGVIVRSREFLRARSRALVVRSPSRCALHMLQLCGLEELVDSSHDDAPRDSGSSGVLAS